MLRNVRKPLKCVQDSYTHGTWAEFVLVPVPAPRFFFLAPTPKISTYLNAIRGVPPLTQKVFLQVFRFFSLSKLTPSLLERCTSHGSPTLADLKLGNIIQNSILSFKDRTEEYVKV